MAPFNPAVPDTKDPNFGAGYTAVKQPHFTSATAEAVKAGTEIMGTALKGADEIIRAFATDETRVAMEGQRAQYTAYLDDMDAKVRGGVIAGPGQPGKTTVNQQAADQAPMNILPSGETVPPTEDLRNFPKKLAAIQGARASGKIPETEYYAVTDAILSDIRSRYPIGYRDWIDAQAEKTLGFNSAQKLITSKLADINSFLSTKQDEFKAVEGQFRTLAMEGNQGAPAALQRFMQDRDVIGAQSWIARENAFKWRLVQQQAAKTMYENNEEGQAQAAERDFISNHKLQSSYWFMDLEAELKSKGVTRDELGNWKIPDNQKDMVGQMILNKKQQFEQFLRMNASQEDQNGRSLYDLRKPAIVNQHIKELSQQFTDAADRIYNDKSGQIGMQARLVASIETEATMYTYRNLPVAPYMKVIRNSAGESAAAFFFQQGGVPLQIQNFLQASKINFAAQDPKNPWSLKEPIDKAKEAGIPLQNHFNRTFINSITGKQGLLGEGDDDFKIRLAAGIANPKNGGLLADVDPEYRDWKGKYHEGRIDFWNTLSSKDVAKEIYRLDSKAPGLYTRYKDTFVTEFREGIFKDDLRILQDLPTGVGIRWDSEAHRWNIDKPVEGRTKAADKSMYGRLEKTIEHLNQGIKGIANISEAGGVDPNAAILQMFQDMGYDLTKSNVHDVPTQILESIKKQKIQDELAATREKELRTKGTTSKTGGSF